MDSVKALLGTGADLFDLCYEFPLTLLDILPHGFELQRQSLLIVRGDASVDANFHHGAMNIEGVRKPL